MKRHTQWTLAVAGIAMLGLALAAMQGRAPIAGQLPNLARDARDHRDFVWDSIGTPDVTLYTTRGGFAAARAPACLEEIRLAIPHALQMIGESAYPGHARVFLVSSRDPDPPADRAVFEAGGWLREGLPAAAEDLYLTYTYRGIAAQWEAEGALLPLDSLTNAFYRQDDLAAYLQS